MHLNVMFWGSCSKKVSKNGVGLCNEANSPEVWPHFKVLPNSWSRDILVCVGEHSLNCLDVYVVYIQYIKGVCEFVC